ncbi:MAG: hypothetical protein BWY87_01718 [Deltaproteobacteria bacterium ADurb.Bin510]|nr:MAG: hypothetical protein BWY87_01718 [Deltaproteobacteria bacterium ADurb.Bin510]
MPAISEARTLSRPSVGPTSLEPSTVSGTGRAPAFSRSASACASAMLAKPPWMIPSPLGIASWTTGAEIGSVSRKMAKCLFTFAIV